MTVAHVSREGLAQMVRRHTANVCLMMLNAAVEEIDPASHASARTGGAVVALVGLTGAWSGSGVLTCSGDLARKLSGRMLMTEFSTVDADVLDAMGEVANMIVGNVKEDVARDLGPLAISTPTVIYGEGLQTRSVEGETEARLWFACDDDVLEVRISLVPSRPGA